MDKHLSIAPQELSKLVAVTGNIYKTVVVIAKRAKQVNINLKEELGSKLNDFMSHTEVKDSIDIQRQNEITQFYEKKQKPVIIATNEFLNNEIQYRSIEDKD